MYNLALETRIHAYRSCRIHLSKFDLIKQLPDLKDINWISDVPAQSLQAVVERMDSAYQSFFKGGGFPRWAKKDQYNSILFKTVRRTRKGFVLPKLGEVKIFKDQEPKGEFKTAIITKQQNDYFICIACEVESENLYPTDKNQVVGLDMGITRFLTDSNGQFIDNPKHFKQYERKLRIEQRSLARKKKGSKSRDRQKERLQKLYSKIANVRRDFLHKISTEYIRANSVLVCEDLRIQNMIKFDNLGKHISDVSWYTFFSMLKYKSELYEKEFLQVDPKYTSQKCSSCGHIAKENRLTQSKFNCVSCGHRENADLNAAKNILSQGMALVRQREAVACA